jgi:uncharacterized protein YjbI with pentapeptide repeats
MTDLQCSTDGCIGHRLPSNDSCLAHSSNDVQTAALASLREGRPLNFIDGVEIDETLLERIKSNLPVVENRRVVSDANLRGCNFSGRTDFDGVTFAGSKTQFWNTTFDHTARFNDCIFQSPALMSECRFNGRVEFTGTSFLAGIAFQKNVCKELVTFRGIKSTAGVVAVSGIFDSGHVVMDEATITGSFQSIGSTYTRGLSMRDVVCHGWVNMSLSTFADLDLANANFASDLELQGCTFTTDQRLGPLSASGLLNLEGAVFDESAEIDTSASLLSALDRNFDHVSRRLVQAAAG